jgi:hypothetical protein
MILPISAFHVAKINGMGTSTQEVDGFDYPNDKRIVIRWMAFGDMFTSSK